MVANPKYHSDFLKGLNYPTKLNSKVGDPINLDDFDIDFWIESDILNKIKGSNLRADVKFREILNNTPGFGGLRPNKKGFSIIFKPSTKN